MNANLIHIFKPGRHITMAGEAIEFTEADLAATARAYDPRLHEAPLVIGHPTTDAPAQGWVQSLVANARGLFAAPRDVDPAFAEQVGKRRYAKVSAKFYRPDSPNNPVPGVWYLRHVGFLGAQPPAVKGLEDPAFADDADGCVAFQEQIEFAEAPALPLAYALRRLREWLLAKFGMADADEALPGWCVDELDAAARQPDEAVQPAFAEAVSASTQLKHEEIAVTPEEKARLEAENAQLKQQLAELLATQAAQAQARRHQDNVEFAEQLVAGGKLAPKYKDVLVAVLDHVGAPGDDGKDVEFGEGDDKQPLAQAFRAFLAELGQVVEFGESATRDRAATSSQVNPLLADAERRATNHKE